MSRPAGSAFPLSMFTTNPRTWNAPVVEEPKVAPPPAGKNGKPTLSRTAGATVNKNPLAQKLAFGGTRRKGGKRSKTRRVTRRQRRR